MITTITNIVPDPALVTTVAHVVWTHLPVITEGLRFLGAALSVVVGVRALHRGRNR